MEVLEVQKAFVVGHSLGGSQALRFAQRNPDKLLGLCLINPGAYREGAMRGRWFWEAPFLADVVLGALPPETIARIALKKNFQNDEAISEQLESMYRVEAERLEEDIQDSRLVVLPGLGHSPHLEAPHLVAKHVLEFLISTRQNQQPQGRQQSGGARHTD